MTPPVNPTGTFNLNPDITLPNATANPVTVGIQASNLPIGTPVSVLVVPEQGAPSTVTSTPLAGSTAASTTATAQISLISGQMHLIYASASLQLTATASNPSVGPANYFAQAAPSLVLNGEKVTRVQVAASLGSDHSNVYYITESRKVVLAYSSAERLESEAGTESVPVTGASTSIGIATHSRRRQGVRQNASTRHSQSPPRPSPPRRSAAPP